MTRLMFIASTLAVLWGSSLEARQWEIIRLDYVTSEGITSTIRLMSNNLDPFGSSTTDTYRLEIDGRPVHLPHNYLWNLASSSRVPISFDSRTGGIVSTRRPAGCPGFTGPAGKELYVRYMKFLEGYDVVDQKNHRMKLVYTEGNCRYETEKVVYPRKTDSKVEAAKIMTILDTIKRMQEGF